MFRKSYRLIIFLFFPISVSAATVTKTFVDYPNVHVEYDYDNVTNKMALIRVTNNSEDNFCGQFRKNGNTAWLAQIFTANSGTTNIAVPQNGSNSIVLTFNSKGQPDNIQGQLMYPFPHAGLNPDTTNPCADF